MTIVTQGKKIILVIEDDFIIRNCIVEILEDEGYIAYAAENGQEALDHLHSEKDLPALILLDMMMPVMDGWQFRLEQEQDARIKNIPVIVITADGHAQQKAKKLNAEGWIKKPIEINLLLTAIEPWCA